MIFQHIQSILAQHYKGDKEHRQHNARGKAPGELLAFGKAEALPGAFILNFIRFSGTGCSQIPG